MKVLVAEDDQAIVDVVTIILEGEGHQIVSASSEEEVIQVVQTEQPDLILLDVSLHGSHGGEVAKKLKSASMSKHIPVIIVSGNSETHQIAKDAGAEGFLLKPFDIDELVTTVAKYHSS